MPRQGYGERNPKEKERDRALISRLYCQGWTYIAIGEELAKFYPQGKDPSTGEPQPGKPWTGNHVWKELQHIRKMWLRDQLGKYDERQAQELEKVDNVEREAWAAWRRTVGMETEQTVTTEYVDRIDGKTDAETGQPQRVARQTGATVRRKSNAGAAAFLGIVLNCVEKRCKILGIGTQEDPAGLESSEYGTKNVYGIPSFVTKDEWLKKYASGPTVVVEKKNMDGKPLLATASDLEAAIAGGTNGKGH